MKSKNNIEWTITMPLECVICTNFKLDQTILHPCNHVICNDCFDSLNVKRCPFCKAHIKHNIFNLFRSKSAMYNIRAACPYADCKENKESLTFQKLKEHLERECDYHPVTCDCYEQIERIHILEHKKTVCPEVMEMCEFCGDKIKRKDKQSHTAKCIETIINCPNAGCIYKSIKIQIKKHKHICNYRIMKCPTTNCRQRDAYFAIKDHIENCSGEICKNCNRIYPSSDMENHLEKCLMVSTNCPICNKFMTKKDLISHMKNHDLERETYENEEKESMMIDKYIKCFNTVDVGDIVGIKINNTFQMAKVLHIIYDNAERTMIRIERTGMHQSSHKCVICRDPILPIEDCIDYINVSYQTLLNITSDMEDSRNKDLVFTLIFEKMVARTYTP